MVVMPANMQGIDLILDTQRFPTREAGNPAAAKRPFGGISYLMCFRIPSSSSRLL